MKFKKGDKVVKTSHVAARWNKYTIGEMVTIVGVHNGRDDTFEAVNNEKIYQTIKGIDFELATKLHKVLS